MTRDGWLIAAALFLWGATGWIFVALYYRLTGRAIDVLKDMNRRG